MQKVPQESGYTPRADILVELWLRKYSQDAPLAKIQHMLLLTIAVSAR
jgi:hypothetical protein